MQRKSSPKIIGGKPLRKNNSDRASTYYNTAQPMPIIDRKRPGAGFRHLLKQKDISQFISILPDWSELSIGLNAIVLAPGDHQVYGYHRSGVVHVCAWYKDFWLTLSRGGYEQEREFLEKVGVPIEQVEDQFLCKFTESTARAHQLLVTLLHELGHHHDRMTSKRKYFPIRGEAYAEEYARNYAEVIWDKYLDTFGFI